MTGVTAAAVGEVAAAAAGFGAPNVRSAAAGCVLPALVGDATFAAGGEKVLTGEVTLLPPLLGLSVEPMMLVLRRPPRPAAMADIRSPPPPTAGLGAATGEVAAAAGAAHT